MAYFSELNIISLFLWQCDGSCSPRMESREVHCANEEGTVFPNDACENPMPELTRPCPQSEICDPMWHTSEWTEVSSTELHIFPLGECFLLILS